MEQNQFHQTKTDAAADTKQVTHLPLTVVMATTDAVQAYYTARALHLAAHLPFQPLSTYSFTIKIEDHEG